MRRIGCWALIGLPAVAGAYNEYYQWSYARSWSDAVIVAGRLEAMLPGFDCPSLAVVEAFEPSDFYGGGSILVMDGPCTADLRERLDHIVAELEAEENTFASDECFVQDAMELCFEKRGVYFGTSRPG